MLNSLEFPKNPVLQYKLQNPFTASIWVHACQVSGIYEFGQHVLAKCYIANAFPLQTIRGYVEKQNECTIRNKARNKASSLADGIQVKCVEETHASRNTSRDPLNRALRQ